MFDVGCGNLVVRRLQKHREISKEGRRYFPEKCEQQ
jgi:hypothetical protein